MTPIRGEICSNAVLVGGIGFVVIVEKHVRQKQEVVVADLQGFAGELVRSGILRDPSIGRGAIMSVRSNLLTIRLLTARRADSRISALWLPSPTSGQHFLQSRCWR